MQLKEKLRNILPPKWFHIVVLIKNSVLPTKSFIETRSALHSAIKFYESFINVGDLVFDVGANYGNRVKVFLAVKARVVAIEPQKQCVDFMRAMYGKKSIILQKGVGSKSGEMDFFMSDNSALSSFSQEWISKVKGSDRFYRSNWQDAIKVEVTTLDQLINKYGIPSFIKIDVEGLEYEVLKGLNRQVKMISFEYAVPENHPALTRCLLRLSELGNYRANYSVGESMKFQLPTWVALDEFLTFVDTKEFLDTFAGDVYVKLQNRNK